MPSLYPFSLKIRNFKCFGNDEQGFDEIKPLNLILGRNNSGKSTLLDFLEQINIFRKLQTSVSKDGDGAPPKELEISKSLYHKKLPPKFMITVPLTHERLAEKFSNAVQNIPPDQIASLSPEDLQLAHKNYLSSKAFGQEIGTKYANARAVLKADFYLNTDIECSRRIDLRMSLERIKEYEEDTYLNELFAWSDKAKEGGPQGNEYKHLFRALQDCACEEVQNSFGRFWKTKIFKRINPDRNILAERDDIENLEVSGDGKGITNIIQNFYNKEELDRNLVEREILSDLNLIFKGDACFDRILPRRKSDGKWEIALEEEHKGLIPLSQSGSSLKTVMIILAYLYLVPLLEKQELSDYAFLIEEIENNLHPSLLRRLLLYIADRAKKDGCIFFLATHSSIAIDMFSNYENAQIIHVTHDGESSYAETVDTSLKGLKILDDLGVKASDLLQANGIIWVEGPSDVIYIDKWLEMYCRENQEEKPRRRINYEFQMFGGTLLDSLCLIKNESMSEDEERRKLVSMFSFSRNAFVVIDSDAVKDASKGKNRIIDQSSFEAAKTFISSQFNQLNDKGLNLGLWYKAGNTRIRTLEDYLDRDTLQLFPKKQKPTKKIYAQRVTESWGDSKRLDEFPHGLKKEIQTLYELIKKWNQ